MIKEIISNRNEAFTFYVQCSCGQEVIQFYYYKDTNIDPKIIGVKYFGYLKDYRDSRCANFSFSEQTFNKFIDITYEALATKIIHGAIKDGPELLVYDKDEYGFYRLLKARNNKMLKKGIYVWDICLREAEVSLIYKKLLEMREVIRNDQGTNY